MNSIYLRSISDNLRSYSHLDLPCECNHCKKRADRRWKRLFFCCCSCANIYHLKYDIAAVNNGIHTMLWLLEYLPGDLVHIISSLVYQLSVRPLPPTKCDVCGRNSYHLMWSGDNEKGYCSKKCKNILGYDKKLMVYGKSPKERNTFYKC